MSSVVIAVSGPPGAGKTTLARAVAARLGGRVVEYDRYETFTRQPLDRTLDWLRRGAPYEEIETPGLADAVRHESTAGPVVLDTPLGRAHPQTGPLIDIAIWIDCPADLALARKLGQLSAAVPPERAADFLAWMRGYLDAYGRIVRPACLVQANRVRPTADMIVDGTADPGSVAVLVVRRYAARLQTGMDGEAGESR